MFTLDLSTYPNIVLLSQRVKEFKKDNEETFHFTLNWAGLFQEGIPISIETWKLRPDADWAGIHQDGEITIRTFGKRGNSQFHRGGIVGTIYHEFFHYLQWYGCMAECGDWFWDTHHTEQKKLYDCWSESFEGFYAGSFPWEAAAEVYRVISGYTSAEAWEKNQSLKKDYLRFFQGNEMIKHFVK